MAVSSLDSAKCYPHSTLQFVVSLFKLSISKDILDPKPQTLNPSTLGVTRLFGLLTGSHKTAVAPVTCCFKAYSIIEATATSKIMSL